MKVFLNGHTPVCLTCPGGGYVIAGLLLTHVTIAAVTIFLHRHQAHRALEHRVSGKAYRLTERIRRNVVKS